MLRRFLPYLIFGVYRTWISTWQKFVFEPDSFKKTVYGKEPVIFAIWHGDEMAMLGIYKRHKVATMTSTSKDGEMMKGVLDLLDIQSSRGSSTRGGVGALKGLLRLAKAGRIPLVPVDGPKGPYHKVKPGVFELSKILGAKIIPGGAAASRAIVFEKSWNKAYLPSLFCRFQIVWGEPLPAVGRDEDVHDPKFAERLEAALNAVGQEASKRVARH